MSSVKKPIVKKKKRWGKVVEFTSLERDLHITEESKAKIIKEISKAKVITPQEVADKYAIRVSTAKRILAELEEQGKLKLLTHTRRVRVYTKA